jgi:hypothetical protein
MISVTTISNQTLALSSTSGRALMEKSRKKLSLVCIIEIKHSAGLRHVGDRYIVRFGPPVSKFSATGGGCMETNIARNDQMRHFLEQFVQHLA